MTFRAFDGSPGYVLVIYTYLHLRIKGNMRVYLSGRFTLYVIQPPFASKPLNWVSLNVRMVYSYKSTFYKTQTVLLNV